MPVREASAVWEGDLETGKGKLKFGHGLFEGNYSYASRFEEGKGTNPEELIGAAHAGCFSMAFAGQLARGGYAPEKISTRALVSLEKAGDGFAIKEVLLETTAKVPGIEDEEFQKIAADAKANCPVSRALAGTAIRLDARLED